jgi:hypothetical protein
MFGYIKRFRPVVHHQWFVPIIDWQSDSEAFYTSLTEEIKNRQLPGITVERINLNHTMLLSPQQSYIRLRRERFVFDVCSAPFGSCWWFSGRAAELPRRLTANELSWFAGGLVTFSYLYVHLYGVALGLWVFGATIVALLLIFMMGRKWATLDEYLVYLPVVGAVYEFMFRRDTYWQQDQRMMFSVIINALIREKVKEFCIAGGANEPLFQEIRFPQQVLTPQELMEYGYWLPGQQQRRRTQSQNRPPEPNPTQGIA